MLTVSDLRVSYGMSEVIHGINLEVGENETVAIMGRNGMGKTTLFKSLIGMIPCSGGEITFNNKELSKLQSYQRVASGIAYVPQGRMVFPTLTVEENIMAGLEVTGRRKVPDDIYELFPVLLEMRHRKAGNLSGGQQQQLAIGRALLLQPRLLILDEPCEGIQPNIVREIGDLILRLNEETGLTVLIVEQKLPFARRVASDFRIMDKGRCVAGGEIAQLSDDMVRKHLTV